MARIWHVDNELRDLVTEMAQETGQSWEHVARATPLNGLSYSCAVALQRGETDNEGLARRIEEAAQKMATAMPVEYHSVDVSVHERGS